MDKYIIIVDPIKSGYELIININSIIPAIYIYTLPKIFLKKIGVAIETGNDHIYSSDPYDISNLIKNRNIEIEAVIPASEPSTQFVIELSKILGLPSIYDNNPSRFRCKHSMRKHAYYGGINIPKYTVVNSDERDFCMVDNDAYIIKPLMSAGADSVRVVKTKEDICNHIETNRHDVFGNRNTQWLLEEYIYGTEYSINTISSNNEHHIIDMWEYCRPTSDLEGSEYDTPYWNQHQVENGILRNSIEEYVHYILKQFQVEFGYSHIEIKKNINDSKFYLIEIGWRLPGSDVPYAWEKIWGIDVYHDIVNLYSGKCVDIKKYTPNKNKNTMLGIVFFSSPGDGYVSTIDGMEIIEENVDYFKVDTYYDVGDKVEKTNSLQNFAAKIMVKGSSKEDLERKFQLIRSLVRIDVS